MSSNRNWCFTLNNYTDNEISDLQSVDKIKYRYIIFAKEVAPTTGTPHLQGFVVYKSAKTFTAVKKLFPQRVHLEQAKGNIKHNISYVKKVEGFKDWTPEVVPNADVYEDGDKPLTQEEKGTLNRERYTKALELARQGNFAAIDPNKLTRLVSKGLFDDIDADLLTRHYSVYKKYHTDHAPKPAILDGDLEHEWHVGPPGCGKSSNVWKMYPDAYNKSPKTVWWDGYKGEDVVVIEDFDKYCIGQSNEMKLYLDRYPFPAQVKNGFSGSQIRPKKVIVTSNYLPEELWSDDDKLMRAITRRVKIVEYEAPPEIVECTLNGRPKEIVIWTDPRKKERLLNILQEPPLKRTRLE